MHGALLTRWTAWDPQLPSCPLLNQTPLTLHTCQLKRAATVCFLGRY